MSAELAGHERGAFGGDALQAGAIGGAYRNLPRQPVTAANGISAGGQPGRDRTVLVRLVRTRIRAARS